jgi:2-polyprenyl-6-methoxyphenol hydroxylase-like FAD-dependent oxidoreductase
MRDPDRSQPQSSVAVARQEYDAAIIGASLAGCTAAIMLAREGARVALVEQRADPGAFKRICSHYIQSSAVPTLERLGLLEPMMQAGAVRSRVRMWTRWGWIEPSEKSGLPSGVNLRRELLDPLIRKVAMEEPGVETMLGQSAQLLLPDAPEGSLGRSEGSVASAGDDGEADARGAPVSGVVVRDRDGRVRELRAKLVVGADGRGSRVAKLAGVSRKTAPHGRFAYGGYFEGPPLAGAPDASLWFLDPQWAAAFPTDHGKTFYAVMPTKDRLPEFRSDPEEALKAFLSRVPDAPPILDSTAVELAETGGKRVLGKLDMTNVAHAPTAPGVALVGDAALAIDPLFGVGCGWAIQSSEWLADSVAPALRGAEPLAHGLKRYRRSHSRALRGHAAMINDYADGRALNRGERLIFSGAARDERVARVFEAFGTRNIGPSRMLANAIPLALVAHARRLRSGRRASAPRPSAVASTASAATASAAVSSARSAAVGERVGELG